MELKIFENEQFGQVRIAMDENGEPIFCLADLCLVLDLTPSKVAQRLGEDVLSKYPLLTAGGIQQANFVNEDDPHDVVERHYKGYKAIRYFNKNTINI